MDKVAALSNWERAELFNEAAGKLSLNPSIIEKDFWVTWVLGKLFSSEFLSTKLLFKGGTALSKVFNLIKRFSEDIDLILDWNQIAIEDPNQMRSKTKQDRFNKAVPGLVMTWHVRALCVYYHLTVYQKLSVKIIK